MMELRDKYFNWLCNKVCVNQFKDYNKRYWRVLRWLHARPFNWTLPMDQNRSSDGIRLRYIFGDEQKIMQPIIAIELDYTDCSMLEMMVALDNRCAIEEREFPEGYFGEIFWMMIHNLGLDGYSFSEIAAEEAIQRVENHQYAPDGTGGLFRLANPRTDLRRVDIWYQAMWYYAENSNLEV